MGVERELYRAGGLFTGLRAMALLGGLGALAGCGGSNEAIYRRETFEVDSPYQHPSQLGFAQACEGSRRALLGQGYIIDTIEPGAVKGKKAFRAAESSSTFLEMNIVCLRREQGAMIFANAVQTTYEVKKNLQAASVGVPALGTLSVPVSGSTDSMVKVGDETITDKQFYQRFFLVVDHYLDQVAVEIDSLPAASPNARPAQPAALTAPDPQPSVPMGAVPAMPAQQSATVSPVAASPAPMPLASPQPAFVPSTVPVLQLQPLPPFQAPTATPVASAPSVPVATTPEPAPGPLPAVVTMTPATGPATGALVPAAAGTLPQSAPPLPAVQDVTPPVGTAP